MSFYPMASSVLRVQPQAREALLPISSNTLEQPQNAFLDKQGRIIATVSQLMLSDAQALLVVSDYAREALLQHLGKLLMFSQAQVEIAPLRVYFDLSGLYCAGAGEWCVPMPAGQLVLTPNELTPLVAEQEFTAFRLAHNLPLHGLDYTNEMLLNVAEAPYVSYQKGCFLGQEIIARVHYKSKPPRRLTVRYLDELDAQTRAGATSVIVEAASGRQRGFVFENNKSLP